MLPVESEVIYKRFDEILKSPSRRWWSDEQEEIFKRRSEERFRAEQECAIQADAKRKVTSVQSEIESAGLNGYIHFYNSVRVDLEGQFSRTDLLRIIAEMKDNA